MSDNEERLNTITQYQIGQLHIRLAIKSLILQSDSSEVLE